MKKVYEKPSVALYKMNLENAMMTATSISNSKDDVQPNVKEDHSGDFEAGAKKDHFTGAWEWDSLDE